MIVYQAGEREMIKSKVQKICESFGANRFELPADSYEFKAKQASLQSDKLDTQATATLTKKSIE